MPVFVSFLPNAARRVMSWEGKEQALLKIAQSNTLLKQQQKNLLA